MRLILSCALVIAISPSAREAAAVDYCPLQLQGQYGNSYYYYCQTKQGTNCTYSYAMVGQALQCGGCCDGCCDEDCINVFSQLEEKSETKKKAETKPSSATPSKFEDTEVVPLQTPTPQYIKLADRFCTPGRNYTVTEVWIKIDGAGGPFYFRCFDVTDKNRPREKLRVGHQYDGVPDLNVYTPLKADYDTNWPHKSPKVHRVTVNDPQAPDDDRPFYLFSVAQIVQ